MATSLFPFTDHLIFGVPDLHSGTDLITKWLGAAPVPGGKHRGFGTHNTLLKIGNGIYLEVIAPDPEQAATGKPIWMGLDRLSSPALIWWAAKADNLQTKVQNSLDHGWDLGDILAGNRALPNGNILRWQLTDPYKVQENGVLPFLIDWAGGPHPTDNLPDSGCELVDFQLLHPEPEKIHAYLAALELEVPVQYHVSAVIRAGLQTPSGLVYL